MEERTTSSSMVERVRIFITKNAVALCVIICVLVASIVHGFNYKPTYYIDELDTQRNAATTIMSASVGASLVITALPDDFGTSIADEMDDVTGYIIVALSCIEVEHLILLLSGTLSFFVLIPASAILYFLYLIKRNKKLRSAVVRIFTLGVCLVLIIPISIGLSNTLKNTLNTDETMNKLTEISTVWQDSQLSSEDQGFWDKLTGTVSSLTDTMGKIQEIGLVDGLYAMVEATAITLVCSLVMPIIVVLLLWFISRWAIRGVMDNLTDDVRNDLHNGLRPAFQLSNDMRSSYHRGRKAISDKIKEHNNSEK